MKQSTQAMTDTGSSIKKTPTFEQFRQMTHFPALDGMRAIAVVMVIFEHYGGPKLKSLSGWLGVDIFFVMSGFLITTLLLREAEKSGKISLRDFYIRRIFRIAPVYYLILIITVAQCHALGSEYWEQMRHAWKYYAVFLNEQKFPAPWKFTWTMGIEWKFYLVWPVILLVISFSQRNVIISAVSAFAVLCVLWSNPLVQAVHYMVLLLGALMAALLHFPKTFKLLRTLMNPHASVLLFFAMMLIQIYVVRNAAIAGGYGGGQNMLIYSVAVALFIPTIFGGGFINRILESGIFTFIGHRSYSLYLVQILAWQTVAGLVPGITDSFRAALFVTAVGLIFADCLYRGVELPMISIGKRFQLARQKALHPSTA
jgi:peptidoglycan/LPS O-acetylase OafA/YrhL